jgi:hypothetical protein
MHLQLQTNICPGMQPFEPHLLSLAVDGLNRMPIPMQRDVIEAARVRGHIRSPYGEEPDPRVCQEARFISRAVVGFIAPQARPWGQDDGHFMHRRQVVEACWQQLETHGNAGWGTNQVQPPADELLPFGSAVATVPPSTDLATAPGPHTPTNGHRQTVNDKYLAAPEQFATRCGDAGEPVGQGMQAPIEARQGYPPGQVVGVAQHAECPFVMILKVLGGDDCDRPNLRIWHLRQCMTPMIELFHQRVEEDEGGYNPLSVHGFLLLNEFGLATRIVSDEPMNVN